MPNYEVWYVELRYYDQSRSWATSSDRKSIPFEEPNDQRAQDSAKILMKAPSEDSLVFQKVPIKLVKVIELT